MPDSPFMQLSAEEVWRQVRQQSDAIIEIRGDIAAVEDHEQRIRKLERRYYAIIAGLIAGFAGYGFTLGRGFLG
jgi:hypothetical protein